MATAVAVAGVLGSVATAHGASITVGSPLSASFSQNDVGSPGTLVNMALPEAGARVTSPVVGAVVRWRVQGSGTFRLRVLHPDGSGGYTATGVSAPGAGTGATTASFATSLPILAGDLIGLDSLSDSDMLGTASGSGASYAFWLPPFGDNETKTTPTGTGVTELAFNADVVALPAITGMTPASGSTAGATSITISGSGFSNASAVTFGSTPASSFHVDASNRITAVSPAGTPGTVDVRVTTPGGVSAPVAADRFTYVQLPTSLVLVGAPKASNTGATFTVICNRQSACSVTGTLTARTRVRGKRVVGVVAKVRNVKVGSRSATIAAQRTAVIRVPLNAAGRKLLKRFRRLPLRLDARWSAAGVAKTTLTSRKLTIKAKKHKK